VQFLTNEQLTQFFTECKRVTKPNGLIAIKGYDVTTIQIHPIDPFVMWRLLEGMKRNNHARTLGMLRTMSLGSYLQAAGLTQISSKTTASEWTLPLSNAEKAYFSEFLQYVATLADDYVNHPEDLQIWKHLHYPASPNNPLNDPNFYFRESHILFTARKSMVK